LSEWAVPGYTELKALGAGGFGSVVLARHDATGTSVAIKYLLAQANQDPDASEMFRAEAEALGALDDPHVVRLYEYVESPEGAAIVMELVDGVTLGTILSQYGKTSPQAALVVLHGSLLGLAAAHARGVVHRDYKPANVLINAHGASKLTDFGIAARAGTPTIPAGSVAYAPPEQFSGEAATAASDVYAATATFYECLAGRPPFTGPTSAAVIWQHQSADVPMDPVPAPLQPIVARGLAKNARYRPADAAALAAELRTAAIGAYGPDWEHLGRAQLGEAALLLALLWPSAGLPALQGTTVAQARLTQGAQHAHQAQAAHHQVSRAELHRWHVRHVLHLDHLAHTAAVAVTAAAVVAAAVTVAVTSRGPSGPGSPAHPAVAAYSAPLVTIPASLTSSLKPINGVVYVQYNDGASATAKLSGEIKGATAGEVARLYAQQFPYTSAPAPAGSVTLSPAGGTAAYSFSVTPALATRYQVELFASATSAAPLATSAVTTVYVVRSLVGTDNSCTSSPVCTVTDQATIYVPPSALQTEMSKQRYAYFGYNVGPAGTTPSYPDSLQLVPGAVLSAPQRIADNAYQVTVSYNVNVGDGAWRAYWDICTKDTEAQDGLGLPGPQRCGTSSIAAYGPDFG
jgi:eukaryotic-like serine/threonine-protein kinase